MKKKVCIIGAGAAGLAAIRHVKASAKLSGVVFEATGDIGGIWNYTDQILNDKTKEPIHSTAYKGLRVNLPKEIMGFLDFPMTQGDTSFIYHEQVMEYLRDYAKKFSLLKSIQFNTRVVSIRPKWEVTVENLENHEKTIHSFDAVIICNGHYWKPLIPEIKNIGNFKGEIIHSRNYRLSLPFKDKKVVGFGCGPSGIDIMLEISEVASQTTLSMRKPPIVGKLPETIHQTGSISEIDENGQVVFQNGKKLECDIILLCTGYEYDLPFLSPECGLQNEKGKLVTPIYANMINAKNPTMALIGLPFRVCPFILFDLQVRYFVKYLEGEMKLPSEEEMLAEIAQERKLREEEGLPFSRSHQLEQLQWPLFEKLSIQAKVPPSQIPKPFVRKIYEKVAERRAKLPQVYKNDQIILISDEDFEYIEAS